MRTNVKLTIKREEREYSKNVGVGLEWIELYLNSKTSTKWEMLNNLVKKFMPTHYLEGEVFIGKVEQEDIHLGMDRDTIDMLSTRCQEEDHNKILEVYSGYTKCSCEEEYSISEFDKEELINLNHLSRFEILFTNCYKEWMNGYNKIDKIEIDWDRQEINFYQGYGNYIDGLYIEDLKEELYDNFEIEFIDLLNDFIEDQNLTLEFI